MSQTDVAAGEKFTLYSVSDLFKFSQPEWLIENLFPVEALVAVYGPSGHGKSFLTLDWALSIATGGAWLGRPVRQGPVVYIAAEGGRGIRKRVAAWMKERGCSTVPEAFFLLEGVQVAAQEDLNLVASRMTQLSIEPALIVVDTLARCFIGGDENSAQEMGEFVAGLEWLKRETSATVMVVHHTGKQVQEMERGSSALRGAADVMVRVSKNDTLVTVNNNKQKDDEEFSDISLELRQVAIDNDTSCVLSPAIGRSGVASGLARQLKRTLTALATSPHETTTTTEWATAAGLKERTLHSHRKALVDGKYVEDVKKGTYRITDAGRTALGPAATARHLHLVESGK